MRQRAAIERTMPFCRQMISARGTVGDNIHGPLAVKILLYYAHLQLRFFACHTAVFQFFPALLAFPAVPSAEAFL